MLTHDDFYATSTKTGLVRQPVEYAVANLIALGLTAEDAAQLWLLDRTGQRPLYPPNVSGWKPNGYWVNASAMGARQQFVQGCLWAQRRDTWDGDNGYIQFGPDPANRFTKVEIEGRWQTGTDPIPDVEFVDRLIDYDGPATARVDPRPDPRSPRPPRHPSVDASGCTPPAPDRPRNAHRLRTSCSTLTSPRPTPSGICPCAVAHDDPFSIDRRRFLQAVGLGLGAGLVAGPGTSLLDAALPGHDPSAWALGPIGPTDGVLVVVGMYGGNDGLNTVVPINDGRYYDQHGALAIPRGRRCRSTRTAGLHPDLPELKRFWDAGQLAIVEGVGHMQEEFSHFNSMAKWMSGRPTGLTSSGWVGRWLDGYLAGSKDLYAAAEIGHSVPLHMIGERSIATTVPTERPSFGVPREWRPEADAVLFDTVRDLVGRRRTRLLAWAAWASRRSINSTWRPRSAPSSPPMTNCPTPRSLLRSKSPHG